MRRILAPARSDPVGAADATRLARRGEMLSLLLVVCAAVVASKGDVGRRLIHTRNSFEAIVYHPNPFVFALRLLCCCLEDVAVGLCCLLGVCALLRLAGSPRSRALVRALAYVAATLAIVFQLANVKLFAARHEFLRLDLFWLGGGFSPYPGVIESVDMRARAAIFLGPVCALAIHSLGQWAFPSLWRAAAAQACRPSRIIAAAAGLTLAIPMARAYVGAEWSDFARNAHLVFVQSWLETPLQLEDYHEGGGADPTAGHPHDAGRRLARPPRNLIVIVVESVSTRFFESYGCPLPSTPNLRRLAPKSLIFENYYATANYSFGSSMALFAGIYGSPLRRSIFSNNSIFDLPSAGQHLQGLGYKTYFFAAGGTDVWNSLHAADHFCAGGFDVSRDPAVPFWRDSDRPSAFMEREYLDQAMFGDVRRAVRESHAQPFAVLMWAYDTHAPFHEGEGPNDWAAEGFPAGVRNGQVRESVFRSYLKAIWRLDRFVGHLCEDLERWASRRTR